MKLLNGKDIAGFIQQRQVKQVRILKQSNGIQPKLSIIVTTDNPVIDTYVGLKKRYGADIGIEVDVLRIQQSEVESCVKKINQDSSVHGIIIQLPLEDESETKSILDQVSLKKDVDGLAEGADFTPATPQAIEWLLDGYNVALEGKRIALVGRGRLVGAPLEKLMVARGLEPVVYGRGVEDLRSALLEADIVVSATGAPGLIKSSMLKNGAVAVDAGTATSDGVSVGDFAEDVYARDDLTLTPKKGGVGPLTVAALFENVIRAASA